MKTIKTLLGFSVIMTLMSCGNSNNATSTNTPDDRSTTTTDRNNRTDSNVDRMENTSTTRNTTMEMDQMDHENDYGYTDYDRTRMGNLYTHLNLSDDVIKRYEMSSRQNLDTWKKSNPNSTLSMQQRMQLEDQTMKGILDTNQYSTYQQWVRDHPYKN